MTKLIEALSAIAGAHQILENEPMSRHTTFKVGGPADVLFLPESEEQLIQAIAIAKDAGIPCIVIGNGSNLVVRDGGIRGLVIALGEGMAAIVRSGDTITAWAGASLARVSAFAQASGLAGLEFASGIPGTLDARMLLDGAVKTLTVEDMQMGYRTSLPLREGGIVISARFALTPDNPESIAERMRELNARRREKQPLNRPSAGSTFKRPEGHFAGALIEQSGLKGYRVGGAQVSEKHAGFIVNAGGATAKDILTLIGIVQDEVLTRFGVHLETEVRILGED